METIIYIYMYMYNVMAACHAKLRHPERVRLGPESLDHEPKS